MTKLGLFGIHQALYQNHLANAYLYYQENDNPCDNQGKELGRFYQDKIKKYDINDNYKKFIKNGVLDKNLPHHDKIFSYVVHAAGIQLLYSPKINEIYTQLKNNLLSPISPLEKGIEQVIKLVNQSINETICQTIVKLQNFIKVQNDGVNLEKLNKIQFDTKEILAEFQSIIDHNLDKFIYFLKKDRQQFETMNHFVEFYESCTPIVVNIIIKNLNVSQRKYDRNEVKDNLFYAAEKKIQQILADLSLENLHHSEGKQIALQKMKVYNGYYPNLTLILIEILKMSPANGFINNLITKQIATKKIRLQIINAYLNDLTYLRTTNKRKIITQPEWMDFKLYFTLDSTSLQDELKDTVEDLLRKNLTHNLKFLYRPTLEKNHVFVSDNPWSFYANIRLSNRSQKRQIRNHQHAFIKQETVARAWNMGKSLSNQADVIEIQKITGNTLGRQDYIDGCKFELGSFSLEDQA